MNNINKIKKTSNAIKEVSLTFIFIGALLGSLMGTTANAATLENVEHSTTQFVIRQSEQVMTDISQQLASSIAEQVNKMSERYSLQSEVWVPATLTASNKLSRPQEVSLKKNSPASDTGITVQINANEKTLSNIKNI
mgnify:CR=1 FL=1|jgi:hypothetical protein|tara:strand:+ start:147 stop:557 length:411 start_codon:yes stop_codon:yes gene_type:complete